MFSSSQLIRLKKRFFTLFTLFFASFFLFACSEKAHQKVGVIQTSDHEALNATREGVVEALSNAGLIPGKNLTFKWESAQGNPATASQIAQKFIGQKYDVIVGVGTLASQAALQATKGTKIPVIYASVTDPKGSKLTGNISGVSNFVVPDVQFISFKRVIPKLKTIGVVYSPGEQNSIVLNEKMEKVGKELNLTVISAPASKTSDVYAAAMSLVGKADALFVNNDNVALAAFDAVVKVGLEQKIPVFVSDTDLVVKGALAAIGPDQRHIGIRAGRMVVELLKKGLDQRDASVIPEEGPSTPLLFINGKSANHLGIRLSEDLRKEAASVIE